MAGDPVRDAFRAQLALVPGIWTIQRTENPNQQPGIGSRYVTLEWIDSVEEQASWGTPGANLWRVRGWVDIRLVSQRGQGSDAAEAMALAIRNYFRARRFATSEGRDVRIVEISPPGGGEDRGAWIEALLVQYETFNLG